MNDGQDTYEGQEQERKAPVVKYASRDNTVGPNQCTIRTRYKDVFVDDEVGWFLIRNLDDREYSRLTSMPVKTSGQLDRVEAQAQDARLIIAAVLEPETKKPMYTDADLKMIRSWDAAITLKLAYEIRQHIGVPEENEAKKS